MADAHIETTTITLISDSKNARGIEIVPGEVIVDIDADSRVCRVERVGGVVDVGTLATVIAWLRVPLPPDGEWSIEHTHHWPIGNPATGTLTVCYWPCPLHSGEHIARRMWRSAPIEMPKPTREAQLVAVGSPMPPPGDEKPEAWYGSPESIAHGTLCTDHTPHPDDYIGHSNWAEEMLRTHEQRRCAECDRWSIWVRKEPTGAEA